MNGQSRVEAIAVSVVLLLCGSCGSSDFPSPSGDFDVPLAGEYELWRTSSENVVITGRDGAGQVVPHMVAGVGVQGDVITVEQWPPLERKRRYDGSDFHYWIIQTREGRVQGPLTKAEYLDACKKLGVAPDELKPVDYYGQRAYEAATASKP